MSVAVVAAATLHFFAFAVGSRCALVDSTGKIVRQFDLKNAQLPGPVKDLQVSDDGRLLAVTARSPATQNFMLYVWDLETGAVRQLGEDRGFHGAPNFSRDSKWLTFVHHATLGGPIGMHEARAYAQLYIQPSDGSSPARALTSSDGCHMESTTQSGAEIYFTHANCSGGRRIEKYKDGVETPVTEFDSRYGEPALSPDGKRLVVSRSTGDTLEILELALERTGDRAGRSLWRGVRREEQFRPRYLDARRVIFQSGAEIIVTDGTETGTRVLGRIQ